MALEVSLHSAGGAVFRVKVQPGAGRTALAGEWAGAVKLKVGKKPEAGAANRECLAFLAATLGVPVGRLSLLQGERSHLKTVRAEGVSPDRVRERLGAEISKR